MQDNQEEQRAKEKSTSVNNNNLNGSGEVDFMDHGHKQLFKKEELVRLLLQALHQLGFNQSSEVLEKESGIFLHSKAITEFCRGVLEGNWQLVEQRIPDLSIHDAGHFLDAKFLIYQQKFLELLEERKTKEALECLRNDIATLNRDPAKLHKLSSFLMCASAEDVRKKAEWTGAKGNSRATLLKELRDILLPERRLETLISQAIQLQENNCLYHNILKPDISLYQDHSCSSVTKFILEKHSDEVWYIKFSHNGRYLCSASKDTTIVIWDVANLVLTGHIAAISFAAWSPDDKLLLSCGNDNLVKLWDVQTGACVRTFSRHTESVTAVAWLPDGKQFVSGGNDKNIFMMDLDGNEIRSWSCARVNDLAVTHDGKFMIAICQEKKLRIYDLQNRTEDYIQETESPTSLELSNDSKTVLVNISSHEIHAWDIASRRLVQKYRGQKQSRFVIRSCFGGASQAFIISGSEDSQVYIWHRTTGILLNVLPGHSGTVNTVSWNPVNPAIFASCSDDHTIRIWATQNLSIGKTKRLALHLFN